MEHVGFVVLGAGSAGLEAARTVAEAGKQVIVVDPGPPGGLSSLAGCDPKKVLVRASTIYQRCREADLHGLAAAQPELTWSRVISRKHGFTDPVPEQTRKLLAAMPNVELREGYARFTAPNVVSIQGQEISFDGALIATGSHPRPLTLQGFEHLKTSADALDLRQLPESIAVIGGGVVAMELGQLFARLGVRVHLLIRGNALLTAMDADLVYRLLADSDALGMRFHFETEATSIETVPDGYRVIVNRGEPLRVGYVLNAAGRIPSIENLALEAAGIETEDSRLKVDDYLCTTNACVWAAGDAHGRMPLTSVSGYEGRLAADHFLHGPRSSADYSSVPMAVFTDPPLAKVGLLETEANRLGIAYDTVFQVMDDWRLLRIEAEGPGTAKVLYEKHSGRLLGAHLYMPHADNLINLFALAQRHGLTRYDLGEMLYVYPTPTYTIRSLV